MNEIHLSHFTAVTLFSGVRLAGFQVLNVGTDPVYAATGLRLAAYHLNYWLHTLTRLPTFQALWLVAARPQQLPAKRSPHEG